MQLLAQATEGFTTECAENRRAESGHEFGQEPLASNFTLGSSEMLEVDLRVLCSLRALLTSFFVRPSLLSSLRLCGFAVNHPAPDS